MNVINDGKRITVKASFFEMAIIVEAIRKGVQAYEIEGASEHAEQAYELVNKITNEVVIK